MPSAPPPQRGFALRGHHPKQARRRRKDAHVQVEGAVTPKERQAAGRISWDLLDLLRDELTSLQDRAKFVIPIQITGLIGLWVQIASFDVGPARDLALVALGVLLASSSCRSFSSARPHLPSIGNKWSTVCPPRTPTSPTSKRRSLPRSSARGRKRRRGYGGGFSMRSVSARSRWCSQ